MKRFLLVTWLLLPVGLLAWHFGPGQFHWNSNDAILPLSSAQAATANQQWLDAAGAYAQAREALPEEAVGERRRLELAEAKARIQGGDMIAGQQQLQTLIADMEKEPAGDDRLQTGARHELATASYYAAWLMRLEGASVEEWKPETERARQQFRWLAERAERNNGEQDAVAMSSHKDSRIFKANLEATIKLEQMDLSDLLAKPLPKNCPNACKNLSQRKRKQCQSRCQGQGKKKGAGKKKGKQDARAKIKKSNSSGLNERSGQGS